MKRYNTPVLEIERFENEDVVTGSSEYELPIAPADNGTELPIIPAV